jgi:hypothetical protein
MPERYDKLGYALRSFGEETLDILKHDYNNAIMIVTIRRITRISAVEISLWNRLNTNTICALKCECECE